MRKLPSKLIACVHRLNAGTAVALLVLTAVGFPGVVMAAQDAAAAAVGGFDLRPASKQASVTLEGASEPITLTLFEWASAPLSLGFSTYAPQDMVVRAPGGPAAPAVRFVANFGGVLQEQAYLEFALLPAGITQAQAVDALRRSVPGVAALKRRSDANHQFGWSVAECDIAYRSKTRSRIGGVAALGRHGDRYFRLTMHYPLEYGGGFAPRADLVLQEWRWRDTQTGL